MNEDRHERVKPVVRTVLKEILDNNLLLSDMKYFEAITRQQMEVLFQSIFVTYMSEVMDLTFQSLENWVKYAKDIKWEKDSDNISVADIDKVIKDDAKQEEKAD